MISSYIKARTLQFYEWEQRGRGWYLAPIPIDLEPTFEPFFIRPAAQPIIDDGKRPSLLQSFIGLLKAKPKTETALVQYTPQAYEPFPFECDQDLQYLQILLPQHYASNSTYMEQLLLALSYCRAPLSYEIIATQQTIIFQVVCRESDGDYVANQIKGYIAGCLIQDVSYDEERIAVDGMYTVCMDFGLQEEFMRPLATKQLLDSYTSLFALLENLHGEERTSLQILFSGVINYWPVSIIEAVTNRDGSSFFYDAPEMPALAKEKVATPLFAVSIRLVAQALEQTRAYTLIDHLRNALIFASKSCYNALIALGSGSSYDFNTRIDDIVERQSHRSGMLLNVKELANILHFPSPSLSRKLQVTVEKTKAVPTIAIGNEYVLGINAHEGINSEVSLKIAQRLNHMHIIGATGTGKSTLLQSLIEQDIKQNYGCAVFDPHGDLIECILQLIPQERIHDVIIIDPSDNEYPIAFNILSAHSDIEKEILSSDLVSIFKRLSSSWGDQMNSVFANAILAFLESNKGGTLDDLRRFLIEKQYREEFLKTVQDDHIVYYWQKEYPLLKSSSIGSILTRLDSFLRPKVIRNMVLQQQSLDFEKILDTKKILLVKLSHGLIGAENSYLLGSFIVSKLQQAAMARQNRAKDLRSPFFVYIDEFQHFTTHSMSLILSGARKYGLGLVLAHQSMQQLQKEDSELAVSVLANAGTRICLRLGEHDAKTFNNSFASFCAEDLQRLSVGHAIARVERNDYDFTLQTIAPTFSEDNYTNDVVAASRAKYAMHVIHNVEKETITFTEEKTQQPTEVTINLSSEDSETEKKIPAVEFSDNQKSDTIERIVKQKQQSQHRALQQQVKKVAEKFGYKATIEQPILDNTGKVDVSLEKDGKRIACEISVSTDAQWELHNLQKCITANYDLIIMCVSERKVLQELQSAVSQMKVSNTILITNQDGLLQFLESQEPKKTEEQIIKGYRVKIEYKDQNQQINQSINNTLGTILKKRNKK